MANAIVTWDDLTKADEPDTELTERGWERQQVIDFAAMLAPRGDAGGFDEAAAALDAAGVPCVQRSDVAKVMAARSKGKLLPAAGPVVAALQGGVGARAGHRLAPVRCTLHGTANGNLSVFRRALAKCVKLHVSNYVQLCMALPRNPYVQLVPRRGTLLQRIRIQTSPTKVRLALAARACEASARPIQLPPALINRTTCHPARR